MKVCLYALFVALLLLAACARAPEREQGAAASDPLTGAWSGDWGPSEQNRTPVTVDLKWDGANLSGTVNPGPNAIELTKASFKPDTGAITMEADAPGHGGHYTIQGKVKGNTMTGTWGRDNGSGDFTITKN